MNASTIFPPERVTIVGALNVTPDSFSDGGRFVQIGSSVDLDAAVDAARTMIAEGAHVIDVGGESTRPGAAEVSVEEELGRTIRVVEALSKRFDVPISIDTRKSAVAEAALDAGACIVNDVSGLTADAEMATVAARRHAVLILGHTRGTPETMQDAPHYEDVLEEVGDELAMARAVALLAGVDPDHLVVDPGIGFGKRVSDNLALLARAGELRDRLGHPVLVGPSRKSFLGKVTGDPVEHRDAATASVCAVSVFAGADAVRVHDVAGAARAVSVGRALRAAAEGAS